MKAGIITQPLKNNFGGIIQNYALQEALRSLGHDSITVRTTFPQRRASMRGCVASIVRWMKLIGFIPRGNMLSFLRVASDRQRPSLARFIDTHISATNPLPRLMIPQGCEALICGSDQIWRPRYNRNLEDMFLKFAEQAEIIRIAYAASFGVDSWEFSEAQTLECAGLLGEFNSVSVRERSGLELCRRHLGHQAELVADPTLLLDAGKYTELCSEFPGKYQRRIGSYLLDPDSLRLKLLCRIGRRLKKRIRDCNPATASMEEWLAMFRDADFIVTDSFHGTVFAIIFRKPFVTIANHARGNARFSSLLEPLGLAGRMAVSPDEAENIAMLPIDWLHVEKSLEKLRSASLGFLETSLDNPTKPESK